MRVLHSDDKFWITGRGLIFTFSKRRWDPPIKVGEDLIIDGALYEVVGIEMNRPLVPWQVDDYSLGLIVRLATNLVVNEP